MTKKLSYINIAAVLLALLLILMPFHAALVTIYGNFLPYKTALMVWKEVLIIIIGILCTYAVYKDRSLIKLDIINKIAIGILLFSLFISLINFSELSALLFGIKTNLVVFVLFLEAQVLASKYNYVNILKIVLIPASIVAIIAILQPVIFKPELLNMIGYGTDSIDSTQYVESAQDSIRVFSTLGGPNQLGAYLIIPFTLSLALAIKSRKIIWYLLPLFFVFPIYMSYSRSAWIGSIVAAITVVLMQFKFKIQLIVGMIIILLLATFGYLFYSGGVCKYYSDPIGILVHGSCQSGNLGGSDMIRVNSIQNGINSITSNPLGSGVGTAGPASFYTSKPLIVENWYIQIAIEIGLIGLMLYLAFIIMNLKKLYKDSLHKEYSVLPITLFASLCGILVASLFLHTLADSTLSILLFGLLGIVISHRFKDQTP